MARTVSGGDHSIVGVISHLSLYAAAIFVSFIACKVIYNVYFHPLAKFPGPKLAAITDGWMCYNSNTGDWHKTMIKLHQKYGPVVRFAPNELDFASPQAYQDVYAHGKQGKLTFLKGQAYNTGSETNVGIVSAREPAVHREIRKSLSHAFSAKALRLQEEVVVEYMDLLVSQIYQRKDDENGLNMSEWYNWLTFDIIGDLAFGESFDAVKSGEGHPWIHLILGSIHLMALMGVVKRFPILNNSFFKKITGFLVPRDLQEKSKVHHQNSMQKATQRIERGNNDRDDFFSHLLREKDNGPKITPEFILAQSTTLIVAGSETTATALSGMTYFLLKQPEALRHLQEEVRSAFSSGNEINSDSTAPLSYLAAVIEEGLRLYPPVAMGLPRESPGATVDGFYVPAGAVVNVSGFVATHNEAYFTDAYEFHPERWLPPSHPLYHPRYQNDNKDASKPFSLGSRGCLGVNLAYMEMRVVLSKLIWAFDWALVNEDLDWYRDAKNIALWTNPDLRIKFTPVER
ncbi:hypothetical protein DSL72_008729 [Monilinia vaccinii-corymbosi]|uniref:Cytochrome P450 monooxygenase n=1 Tax=Monilinia vaccinii-corymbosi TaxID=61207 RepID=A0A8A3PR49_9HELO|nr:hypothetical protein DSL72_008729 [Monilinia vaccinii-corymbosi]